MKVLYITVPSFFDLEISLIRELSKVVDVKVLMIVSPQSMHSSAFSINQMEKELRIFNGCEFEGLEPYEKIIDRKIWHIANNPDGSLLSYYKLSKQIKRFIKKNGIDLVHTTTSNKASLFLLPFIRKFPAKLYTVHDPVAHHEISIFRKILIRSFRFVHRNILLLSALHVEDIKKQDPRNLLRIYLSKLGVYDFFDNYPISENPHGRYMLFFGRIDYYKGVDILIESYLKSSACKQGVKLIIAGKGNTGNLKDLADTENIIRYDRYIGNTELANLIYHSKFVVLPYRSATQSGALMSAYAFNKPVIASAVGDFPKGIVEGETGLLVPPENPEKLTEAIDKLSGENLEDYHSHIESLYRGDGDATWSSIAKDLYITYQDIYDRAHE